MEFYSGALTWAATATIIDASMSAFPGHVQINKMYLVKNLILTGLEKMLHQ